MSTYATFLTRAEYNLLVRTAPRFMATEYVTLQRRWSLAGVCLSGDPAVLERVHQLLTVLGLELLDRLPN